jgi:Zn-finger nucleic acid-binding protein
VPLPPATGTEKVRYINCPECLQLMQRMNFAGCSGVIIDMCREHGSWFDAKELQRIIQFIRGGGLDRARQKQIQDLEQARRRALADNPRAGTMMPSYDRSDATHDAFDVVWAAGELLVHFLK